MGGREIYDRHSETVTPFPLLTPSPHSSNSFWTPLPGKFPKCLIVFSFLSQTSVTHTQRSLNPITIPHFILLFYPMKPINEKNVHDTSWAGAAGQALLKSLRTEGQRHHGPALTVVANQRGCQTHAELTVAQSNVGSTDAWASCVAPTARVRQCLYLHLLWLLGSILSPLYSFKYLSLPNIPCPRSSPILTSFFLRLAQYILLNFSFSL